MIDWVRRWMLLAVVVAAAVVVVMTPSTTTASTAAFAYDIPSIARNDAHGIGTDGDGPAQFSGWRAEPAPPSAHGRGTSTTPVAPGVATNTASGAADDALRALSASERRAVGSLRQQVADHTAKLEAYRANPAAYDNLGILERAPTAEIRQSIIDGRIRHLTNEIKAFQDQIDKLLGGAG